MSTLSQLQAEIELYGFDPTAYGSRITTWLNEAQRHIARLLGVPSLQKTASFVFNNGTPISITSLPADFIRVNYLYDDNAGFESALEPITDKDYQQLDSTTMGRPMYYTMIGGTSLVVWPTPNLNLTLKMNYDSVPAAMAAGGDTSGFSTDWDDVLKAYALSEAYAAEDDAQMSGFWLNKYMAKLSAMGEDQGGLIDDGPRQVRGAWDL